MKCNRPAFDSELASLPCMNEATWEGCCPEHGGVVPTVPELMTLLGKLTDWGDQGLSVSVGYKRARVFTAQDESHLDNGAWGFVVGTKICGQNRDVGAQGRTFEEALWALCREIAGQSSRAQERATAYETETRKALDDFLRSRHVP